MINKFDRWISESLKSPDDLKDNIQIFLDKMTNRNMIWISNKKTDKVYYTGSAEFYFNSIISKDLYKKALEEYGFSLSDVNTKIEITSGSAYRVDIYFLDNNNGNVNVYRVGSQNPSYSESFGKTGNNSINSINNAMDKVIDWIEQNAINYFVKESVEKKALLLNETLSKKKPLDVEILEKYVSKFNGQLTFTILEFPEFWKNISGKVAMFIFLVKSYNMGDIKIEVYSYNFPRLIFGIINENRSFSMEYKIVPQLQRKKKTISLGIVGGYTNIKNIHDVQISSKVYNMYNSLKLSSQDKNIEKILMKDPNKIDSIFHDKRGLIGARKFKI
jgi:hypothetical protein